MSKNILVPVLGESVTEATVARWLKKEGEKVLVHFSEVDAPEINEPGKTLECPQDQQKARQARDLILEMLSSAKEVGLIIKEEFSELELRAQVYVDGLSVGQELLYKYLAVEGQGNWCETNKSD